MSTPTIESKKSISGNACGLSGNTETICSPKTGEVWKNGTWYPITWNTMYPTYVASSALDIYIYFVQNYQNILIKKILNVSTTKGTYPVLVDDTWRLDGTAETYESLVYIVSSGMNPDKELSNRFSDFPPPIHNYVEQPALPPITTALPNITSTTSMTSQPTSSIVITPTPTMTPSAIHSNIKPSSESRPVLQPWIIAIVILAGLAVLGACIAVFWMMRQGRKRKLVYGEKSHFESDNHAAATAVANNSSTPNDINKPAPTITIAANEKQTVLTSPNTPVQPFQQQSGFISTPGQIYMLKDESMRPQSEASFSNISSRSEPPLTCTDALLIADTFRQRMRKPEWQQQKEEERRQLSEQLLLNELEAEGTLMKKVGKRAHLLYQ